MSVEGDLTAYLLAESTVSDYVATRIYERQAPSSAGLPRIVYRVETGAAERHVGGASRLAQTRMTLECQATTPAVARSVAEAVRQVTDGKRGTIGTTDVRSIAIETWTDGEVKPDDASESLIYVRALALAIWHIVTVPSYA